MDGGAVNVGGVQLPPACMVPLLISGVHLMQGEAWSIDRAVQFFVLAGVMMFIDETFGARVSWTLMSPFLGLAVAGMLFCLAFEPTTVTVKTTYARSGGRAAAAAAAAAAEPTRRAGAST
jgi:hypothetical protein